jgi:hypothetical protein
MASASASSEPAGVVRNQPPPVSSERDTVVERPFRVRTVACGGVDRKPGVIRSG